MRFSQMIYLLCHVTGVLPRKYLYLVVPLEIFLSKYYCTAIDPISFVGGMQQ